MEKNVIGVCHFTYRRCHDHAECEIDKTKCNLTPEEWSTEVQAEAL